MRVLGLTTAYRSSEALGGDRNGRSDVDDVKNAPKGFLADIGVMGGYGVPDEEVLGGFRIVGIVVNQGFDQKTVLDIDAFIAGYRNFKLLIAQDIAFVLEFVAADIAFVKYRVAGPDFPQKITAGQAGIPELKIQRIMGREAVKGIEFDHLV